MQPSDQGHKSDQESSCYSANTLLLSLSKSQLAHEISYQGGTPYDQVLHAARDTNATIRRHYSDFIQQVGRNIYPLIIASDYETDGHSGGVGSTLTLYREDGSIITKSPALGTFYEVYKTCSHLFMGLSVEIGPYLSNTCFSSSGECDQVDEEADCSDSCAAATYNNESLLSSTLEGNVDDEREDDNVVSFPPPWESSMKEFVTKAQVLRQSIVRMTAAAETATVETTSSNSSSKCPHHHNHHTSSSSPPFSLPPPEMRDILLSMLSSIIQFCNTCLSTKMLHIAKWEELNRENFPRIKRCMIEATTLQANLCIRQIMDWRDNTLTEEEWKELYVVIPTVWAVDKENPRKEMFRQLMSPGRAETHLITSEYPRNHEEARTLLGRIVADRAIGHFVFGKTSSMEQIKTVGLSSQIDVTQDDALPAICNALKELNNTKKCDEQIK